MSGQNNIGMSGMGGKAKAKETEASSQLGRMNMYGVCPLLLQVGQYEWASSFLPPLMVLLTDPLLQSTTRK